MTKVFQTGDNRIELIAADGIATLTIAREDKLNALDFDMVRALEQAAHVVDLDRAVRVVIMTGAGRSLFAQVATSMRGRRGRLMILACSGCGMATGAFDALARIRQPMIAMLNGHCLGGGFELATVADYRIAEDHVKVGLPETGIGIIPGWSGTQRAVRRFGSQIVRRMALMGEVFSAMDAERYGLVDMVVAKGAGMAAAHEMAMRVAARGPTATSLAKLLINGAEGEERDAAIEAIAGVVAAASDDLKEGIQAFRQKRKPNFQS